MGTALANVAADNLPARDAEHETSVAAAASQAKAATEARYLVAMRMPRNIDDVRVNILKACKRPRFAGTARYAKPVGGKDIIGPSIRFAEEAARCLGNLLIETPTLYDDHEKRIVRVTVTDLESNLSYSGDITLQKVVERKSLKRGQVAISQRLNSANEITYLVEATEDELLTKQMAAVSKHMRNGVLRLLPGDILEEAMDQVVQTVRSEDAADPDAARKKIVDAFFAIGVGPEQLVEYLGHPLEQIQPAELVKLRAVYAAVAQGEVSWAEAMESKANGASAKSGTSSLKEKVAAKGKKDDAAPVVPSPAPVDDSELDRQAASESGDAA